MAEEQDETLRDTTAGSIICVDFSFKKKKHTKRKEGDTNIKLPPVIIVRLAKRVKKRTNEDSRTK